jgi:hypothetical protein
LPVALAQAHTVADHVIAILLGFCRLLDWGLLHVARNARTAPR